MENDLGASIRPTSEWPRWAKYEAYQSGCRSNYARRMPETRTGGAQHGRARAQTYAAYDRWNPTCARNEWPP